MNINSSFPFVPILLAFAISAGCGVSEDAKQGDAKTNAATQVAARVNSEEITVHQINNVLAQKPNVTPEAAFEAKREILNGLIDQLLARQEAVKSKLDRSPKVVQAIEAARSEILARAYLETIASTQLQPTDEEVKKYYAQHPELFAQRRVFSLEEIAVQAKAGLASGLREQVAKARSLQDIGSWLTAQGVKFTANRGVRAAEQISLEVLPRLQEMKEGAIQLFGSEDGPLQVIRVVATKPGPVDEATASPRIRQYLFNRRLSEAIAKDRKRLRDKAEIAYAGEFAEGAAAAEARAKALAEARAKADASEKAKAEAEARARQAELAKARAAAETKARLEAEAKARETRSKPAPLPQETIDKGVKGLR